MALYSHVTLKKVTIWTYEGDWEKFQSLAKSTAESASHHVREAMKLYIQVLEREDAPPEKIFESEAREEDTCN